MSLEEMQLKIEQARKINLDREITIDKGIAGGIIRVLARNLLSGRVHPSSY